ncbi:LysR family transcriptional regulator [Maridesulfovibrio sp. FT414]|uniref:LysR family transcriptional regulator n=1 Tax=Maridesulfovibrio sp. FT414 TaxID=2979469 RepID=UPI003D800887
MDLCKLRTFRMAAVMLNFNKAAEVLSIAQSTVSTQIKSLEDELGELLFKRIHKRIVLTEAGETMLFYANKLLSIEEEARISVSNRQRPAGTLRLLAPEAISSNHLNRVIRNFLESYPTVNFDISNCSQSGLENELRTESVDLAFVFTKHIDSINLHSEVVLTEKFTVVAGSRSSLPKHHPADISVLDGQTVLLPKAGCGHGLLLRQMLNLDIAKPASVIESTSIEAIKRYVVSNDCIAVLPRRSIQDKICSRQVVELNWTNSIDIELTMVWHKNRTIPEPLAYFMNLARRLKEDTAESKAIIGDEYQR